MLIGIFAGSMSEGAFSTSNSRERTWLRGSI